MLHYCDKTNKIVMSFPWCQVPSPAVNLLNHFTANRISIHMAGQWWTVITITAIGLTHLVSRMNPSTQPHRQPLPAYQSCERKPVCHPGR